jgi:hypothetical protein
MTSASSPYSPQMRSGSPDGVRCFEAFGGDLDEEAIRDLAHLRLGEDDLPLCLPRRLDVRERVDARAVAKALDPPAVAALVVKGVLGVEQLVLLGPIDIRHDFLEEGAEVIGDEEGDHGPAPPRAYISIA